MTPASDTLTPGTQLGNYELHELLGQGGAGRVYRATHVTLNSQHAVKVPSRASVSVRKRLLREGRVQASLIHPNIVRVQDVVEMDGIPCLVMEYIDGPALSDVLSSTGMPPERFAKLCEQILRGVAFAHSKGLVHRDLKPGNIMLAREGNQVVAKITDFGLVKVLEEHSNTRTGTTMGTPLYMSPEQIRCTKHVDARTDVFSLGALFYTLAAGESPFQDDDMYEVFNAIVNGHQPPVADAAPALEARFAACIDHAMSLEPSDRFADAGEMLTSWTGENAAAGAWDFSAVTTLGDEPPSIASEEAALETVFTHEDSSPPATDTAASRSFLPWLLAGCMAVLVVLGVGWFATQGLGVSEPVVHTAPEPLVPEPADPLPPAPLQPEPAVEPLPEPAVEPAPVRAPAPVVRPAPSPKPVTPAPVVVQPEPTPPEAPPPEPAVPEPVEPVAEPEPAPDPVPPPAPPAPRPARFSNATPAVPLFLRDSTGEYRPGAIAPGHYTIVRSFGGPPAPAGRVHIEAGQNVRITCRTALQLCKGEVLP